MHITIMYGRIERKKTAFFVIKRRAEKLDFTKYI